MSIFCILCDNIDIDLCHVYNGNHSIHIGTYLKKSEIESEVCRTELLYSHCHTNGEYWYNSHTGKIISKVNDFRIAALYYAAQIRYKIKNDSPVGKMSGWSQYSVNVMTVVFGSLRSQMKHWVWSMNIIFMIRTIMAIKRVVKLSTSLY